MTTDEDTRPHRWRYLVGSIVLLVLAALLALAASSWVFRAPAFSTVGMPANGQISTARVSGAWPTTERSLTCLYDLGVRSQDATTTLLTHTTGGNLEAADVSVPGAGPTTPAPARSPPATHLMESMERRLLRTGITTLTTTR